MTEPRKKKVKDDSAQNWPIALVSQNKTIVPTSAHEAPHSWPCHLSDLDSSHLPLAHSTPATLASSRALTQTRGIPTTGPLHWMLLPFGILSPRCPHSSLSPPPHLYSGVTFSARGSLTAQFNTAAALTAHTPLSARTHPSCTPTRSILFHFPSFSISRHLTKCLCMCLSVA